MSVPHITAGTARNHNLTISVNAWRRQNDVSKCAEVIQNGDTKAVLLCMVDERSNVYALAAVGNAGTHQQSCTTICTAQHSMRIAKRTNIGIQIVYIYILL